MWNRIFRTSAAAVLAGALALFTGEDAAAGVAELGPQTLGVLYDLDDAGSTRVARYYIERRHIPPANLIGLHLPHADVITPAELTALRAEAFGRLPRDIESLVLVWQQPYAAGCMSITTAFAAGYRAEFCTPLCGKTIVSPLYDAPRWQPMDRWGWRPAMLLPSADEALARDLIDRGIRADGTHPPGTVYLIHTQDAPRNVRARGYPAVEVWAAGRIAVRELSAPIDSEVFDVFAYFTGARRVTELPELHFRPGAVADHLTSTGGVLDGWHQMSALNWIRQGATASYGSVSEPCNHLGKFPSPLVLLKHYLRGETVLESYWKSVQMPGQGLFIGEPLASPFFLPVASHQ
jgi:uncharacterized protein (TIGR03790 family)